MLFQFQFQSKGGSLRKVKAASGYLAPLLFTQSSERRGLKQLSVSLGVGVHDLFYELNHLCDVRLETGALTLSAAGIWDAARCAMPPHTAEVCDL